jgi:hypothetical protein
MIFTLLSHQWKSFWRGRGVGKSLAMQIFIGFLFLYLLACCLALGIELGFFLQKLYPAQDTIRIYCGLILYYFAIDLVLRFLFQELPVLAVQPYLALNIRRGQLVTFLNVRSLFHFLNLVPLFLFEPFVFATIVPVYGGMAAAAFALSILFLTAFDHFGMLYVLRKAYLNSRWLVGFTGAIALFAGLDYFHLFSFSALSALLFIKMLHVPWLMIVPLVLFLLAYFNNRRFLFRNLYVEELSKKTGKTHSTEYAWLQSRGLMGELLALDIRLILRNKRPRSVAVMSAIFLFYGLIFYRPQYLHPMKTGILLFVGLFMTGLFVINYGRFTFAWQSNSFDGLLTSNLPIREYIREKLLLFTVAATTAFFLVAAYGLIDWRILPIQGAAYLYNIGVNSILTVWFATFSYKGVDLSKNQAFNYQGGGGATNFIYTMVVMLAPFVVFLPLMLLGYAWAGIVAVGALGLVGLLSRNWWVDLLTKQFYKRKYLILEGFREK